MEAKCIQLGDYIVIQRQKYTKLQKFVNLDTKTCLGKEQLELRNILNQPYGSTFKMCIKETKANQQARGGGVQRLHSLELCSETELRSVRELLDISASGLDNRDICDDGESQTLKYDDIKQLRDECNDSSKIIVKIVENSKTFNSKTEYSQEKYIKKKEKKYFEYLQIRRPTIRLLNDIFYRQNAEQIMGIRMDTLSQILSYSGVSGYGNYLLYESGTNGLLPAAMLNSIGACTDAQLVHMHPGNLPQKQAILALKLPAEQLDRCISVNIYSALREYYQGAQDVNVVPKTIDADKIKTEQDQCEETEPSYKKQKLDEESGVSNANSDQGKSSLKWNLENKRASALMNNKFDSLVIASKEHPWNILNALLPLVKPSRPFVIFSLCKELLMEMYTELKQQTTLQVTNLHLTCNWLRMYQILPNRTHPEVNMNGNGGYLLTGYTLKT